MTRRPGLSLTEVLVALFIMALGTISILTLFPMGALQMGQAFKDDRTTQAATAAESYMRWYWKQEIAEKTLPGEDFFQAMQTPLWKSGNNTAFGKSGLVTIPTATFRTDNPSYPVFVDPMGFEAPRPTPASQWFLGDNGETYCSRTSLGTINVMRSNSATAPNCPAFALRTCTLLDGYTYRPDSGVPDTATGSIERDMRYNWLWLLRGTSSKTATMSVVVFDKRANLYAPTGSEAVFTPSGAGVGGTVYAFPSSAYPKVQKGGWLLDVTVTTIDMAPTKLVPPQPPQQYVPPDFPPASPTGDPQPGVRNAQFYQVVSVTDTGSGTVNIELQTPIADVGNNTNLQPNHRRVIAPLGVAEVFSNPNKPLTAK